MLMEIQREMQIDSLEDMCELMCGGIEEDESEVIDEKIKVKSFEDLKHGDKIISPIDNQVTEFYLDKDGEKYLAGRKSLFPIFQFDEEDFYIYDGKRKLEKSTKNISAIN